MDLNRLYFDQQIALMRAAEATIDDAPRHLAQAATMAREIACFQQHLAGSA